ncbi:MAG: DUF1211 domain-containing protein, partial [Acidobacteriales bacterium]|nr:DUF1211 domain-containing protein [Terriglobales bacterium]
GRIEAFSDGVYAIAITLLILEIKIPSRGAGPLGTLLLRQWPQFFAYVLSFAFIGIMWINHHRLFGHIRKADNGLMLYNLLLLFGVCAVPFPTALLAQFLETPDRKVAALIFNGTYVVIAVFFNALWHHALRRGLLDRETHDQAEGITRQYAYGPVMYVVVAVIGWFSVAASLVLQVVLALFFAMPPQRIAGREAAASSR